MPPENAKPGLRVHVPRGSGTRGSVPSGERWKGRRRALPPCEHRRPSGEGELHGRGLSLWGSPFAPGVRPSAGVRLLCHLSVVRVPSCRLYFPLKSELRKLRAAPGDRERCAAEEQLPRQDLGVLLSFREADGDEPWEMSRNAFGLLFNRGHRKVTNVFSGTREGVSESRPPAS